ncbi:hypothetical protein NBM05_07325 [Rothia sp. AR01]|uniref:Uncharacterized protein n=1 Tax=Rothia santali TaxID=2949643 RepID=A0A9X2HHJ1_9MICC|nr:hypothetical protein [Rothia santali]MCP3425821.1 hypothetical protein [Rothia santali]
MDSVQRGSPEGVARAAVASLTTWDTVQDASEHDAVDRSGPLFSGWLEGQQNGTQETSSRWAEELVEQGAFTEPKISDYDIASEYKNPALTSPTADTEGREVRPYQFSARWDWIRGDGSPAIQSGERVYTVWVVEESPGRWSVLEYSYR